MDGLMDLESVKRVNVQRAQPTTYSDRYLVKKTIGYHKGKYCKAFPWARLPRTIEPYQRVRLENLRLSERNVIQEENTKGKFRASKVIEKKKQYMVPHHIINTYRFEAANVLVEGPSLRRTVARVSQ
jgi:hypothetical protein